MALPCELQEFPRSTESGLMRSLLLHNTSDPGLASFFCKGPESKYSRLCGDDPTLRLWLKSARGNSDTEEAGSHLETCGLRVAVCLSLPPSSQNTFSLPIIFDLPTKLRDRQERYFRCSPERRRDGGWVSRTNGCDPSACQCEGSPPGPQAPRPPTRPLQKKPSTWPPSHINTCPQRDISLEVCW